MWGNSERTDFFSYPLTNPLSPSSCCSSPCSRQAPQQSCTLMSFGNRLPSLNGASEKIIWDEDSLFYSILTQRSQNSRPVTILL